MLVSYSDSEGSDSEQQIQPTKPIAKPSAQSSNTNFSIDRSTGRIKVNLQDKPDPSSTGAHEDEPAAKRPRLGTGGGAFSGFNAMLPAPKRDNLPATQNGGSKAPARKVFSLRTGAEPAFSRESDAELKELFAEQDSGGGKDDTNAEVTISSNIPKPSFAKPAPPAPAGKAIMFKPLSVSRNTKKKKPTNPTTTTAAVPKARETVTEAPRTVAEPPPARPKINLFSAGTDSDASIPTIPDTEDEIIEDLGPATEADDLNTFQPPSPQQPNTIQSQSLDAIASDLNLSAAERRQLFGRSGPKSNHNAHAVNVVNFNTDAEYAANQQLIASGEQVQHNPVRAIASGKHSLRQLVSSAAGQKEALEESFAQGKRNKKEAGSKYGW